jgi:hypothetical protein
LITTTNDYSTELKAGKKALNEGKAASSKYYQGLAKLTT